jgi:hypothetical protein
MKFQLLRIFGLGMTGVHATGGDPMGMLSSVMAGAQRSLAVAEHRHAKVVKAVRQEAAAFLQNEAEVYGKFLVGYSASLAEAEAEVKDATRLAQAGAAKAAAAPQNPSDWKPNDPAFNLRIKLASQAASAQRALTHADHKNAQQVKQAEEHVKETLEDKSSKLAYRVGDMTTLVDSAKQTLEAVVGKKVPMFTTNTMSTVETSNLTVLEDNLVQATSKIPAKTAAANRQLQDFLAKTDKDVTLEVNKLQKSLDEDVAKPVEIKVKSARVKATPGKAAPASKPLPNITHVEKAKVKLQVPK